ncbi:uncharacterized protein LOC128133591 [Lactuca sativa]|uniref:uncharacterized protein LOC128133591 n=1 Tax=Lactuca sativa TaxID=4236 RepID=UPI0022B07988|nr:uncharacterized protein LOC128133591 [Lactuca sativa]
MNEKKEVEDNAAYHTHKLEEAKKKKSNDKSMPVLLVLENVEENEFGGVEDNDMSEISVEDVVDYSEFVKTEPETTKFVISENSVEFARSSKDRKKVLKEKDVVYRKKTVELTSLVDEDNVVDCDEYFWYDPIENADETKGLSERISWKVKGRYVAEPISKPSNRAKAGTSGTKEAQSETKRTSESQSVRSETYARKPKLNVNIHKSSKQLAEQKPQRYRRYQKNLNERKQFWQSHNSNYMNKEKSSTQRAKVNSQAKPKQCSHCHFCASQKQKGHLAHRKNIAEEGEESDISECDLTSEEYDVMVTNPKKFARRKFPINKNRNWKGIYSSEKVKDEPKISSQKDDEKKESKLTGDSEFD